MLQEMSEAQFRHKIKMTFIILCSMNFCRVFDNGAIPALSVTLGEQFNLSESQLGNIGSIVYGGEVLGKF